MLSRARGRRRHQQHGRSCGAVALNPEGLVALLPPSDRQPHGPGTAPRCCQQQQTLSPEPTKPRAAMALPPSSRQGFGVSRHAPGSGELWASPMHCDADVAPYAVVVVPSGHALHAGLGLEREPPADHCPKSQSKHRLPGCRPWPGGQMYTARYGRRGRAVQGWAQLQRPLLACRPWPGGRAGPARRTQAVQVARRAGGPTVRRARAVRGRALVGARSKTSLCWGQAGQCAAQGATGRTRRGRGTGGEAAWLVAGGWWLVALAAVEATLLAHGDSDGLHRCACCT
jgi:hypothetical protein